MKDCLLCPKIRTLYFTKQQGVIFSVMDLILLSNQVRLMGLEFEANTIPDHAANVCVLKNCRGSYMFKSLKLNNI